VSLFQESELIALVQERGIHIEMCPTSNLQTGAIERIEDHPIGRARELGLDFSVNTDDPGAFGCSMTSEYRLLVDHFGFTEADFEALYSRSLAARFRPAAV
jgi:adenosine deaminase